ncbi:MAG: redox-sensing transcriptional repressor Rex [Thermomicrobium sp.]|uniref:redox-sensing transcriptional repressor Rex n=1 Tax=Thermomicrobium sp. TaxID=1969469 RepID=UPI001B1C3662|nr:redox-sensing transcriptional repressor Rex [Thermomicrobium sp.]MBO9350273.1 redox-sensing transcriptional repressor Rex [Thermomicrobium sp.]
MRNGPVPDIVVRRLPLYLRTLRQLQREGHRTISSEELAQLLGVTAAQIRRDLSYFGRFGKQGYGYAVAALIHELEVVLHLDRLWNVALVGYGKLGQAIAHYGEFEPNGFRITAIFAKSPEHIGQIVNGIVVLPETEIDRVVREQGIRIGIIAVPPDAAQEVADRLVAGGVRAILNYAPTVLHVPPEITVREIDPISALQSMTFYVHGRYDASRNGQDEQSFADIMARSLVGKRPAAY